MLIDASFSFRHACNHPTTNTTQCHPTPPNTTQHHPTPPNTSQHLPTPPPHLFASFRRYDSNQLFAQLGAPKHPDGAAATAKQHEFVARFGELMRNSTRQIVANAAKPGDGIFLPSCLDHGMPLLQTRIEDPATGGSVSFVRVSPI